MKKCIIILIVCTVFMHCSPHKSAEETQAIDRSSSNEIFATDDDREIIIHDNNPLDEISSDKNSNTEIRAKNDYVINEMVNNISNDLNILDYYESKDEILSTMNLPEKYIVTEYSKPTQTDPEDDFFDYFVIEWDFFRVAFYTGYYFEGYYRYQIEIEVNDSNYLHLFPSTDKYELIKDSGFGKQAWFSNPYLKNQIIYSIYQNDGDDDPSDFCYLEFNDGLYDDDPLKSMLISRAYAPP